MAADPYAPADIVERLAHDPDPRVRTRVAARFGLSAEVRAELEQDPDEDVWITAAAFGAATTKAQHSALRQNTLGGSYWPAAFQYASSFDLGDPDWYRAAECTGCSTPQQCRASKGFDTATAVSETGCPVATGPAASRSGS